MNILIIAPHPDDESIGCGGAICLHAARDESTFAVFLTSGELGMKHLPRAQAWQIREAEARKAAKVLNVADVFFLRCNDWGLQEQRRPAATLLRPLLKKLRPNLLYLPHPQESHPDHKATLGIVRAALRGADIPAPMLRGYEVWTPLTDYAHAIDISSVMAQKLRAVRAHRSQLQEFNYAHAIKGLNRYRGALAAKCQYAEVFSNLND